MALPYATENQLKLLEQKTKSELDRKTANINLTANTLEEMNALIASGAVNDGQLCYLKEDKKLYVLKDEKWEEVGGGKSVPPTLWLFSFDSEGNPSIKTTITQEEKDNLDNGLYNQVMYYPNEDGMYNTYTPSKLFSASGENIFTQFNVTLNSGSAAVKNASLYGLIIGEKDTSGNYPITIEKQLDIEVGGGGGGVSPVLVLSDSNLHARTTITKEEKTNIAKKLYNSVFYYDASFYSLYLPEIVNYIGDSVTFSVCSISVTNAGNVVSGFNIYTLDISNNENEDGTYPITISKSFSLPLAGGNSGVNIATIEIDRTPTRENTPISIIDTSMLKDDTQFVYIKDTSTNYKYMLCRVGDDFTNVWTDNISQGETIDYLYLHINGNDATLYHFNSKLGTVTFED